MIKRVLALLVLILVLVVVYWLFFKQKENTSEVPKQKALGISKNSDAFNSSFDLLLSNYLELKDALVVYDTSKANAASKKLYDAAEALKLDELKGDSTGALKATAKDNASTISGSAKALVGETDLTEKKREFHMISNALYDLVRTVNFDQKVLYYQECPMAFNETEAAQWISNSSEIVNPYLGNSHPKFKSSMLHCGEIKDSVGYKKN